MSRRKITVYLAIGLLGTGLIVFLRPWRATDSNRSNWPLAQSVETPAASSSAESQGVANQELINQVHALRDREQQLDQTIWADEILAQRYEQVFIDLWDRMRESDDKFSVLSGVPFDELAIGEIGPASGHEHGIEVIPIEGNGRSFTNGEWKDWLNQFKEKGWLIEQSEWRQTRFEKEDERGARSVIALSIHAKNPGQGQRCILKGNLGVSWKKRSDKNLPPQIASLDATHLQLSRYEGEVAFQTVMNRILPSAKKADSFEPVVLLYDLNRDGLSEIILAVKNILLWNLGGMRFKTEPFLAKRPSRIFTGILGDFTNDGHPDFAATDKDGLLLWTGDQENHFLEAPARVWLSEEEPLFNVFGMSAGDVDGDDDLDLWFGQYKKPYLGGQMPTPYYDANDGFPSFLLLNEGGGKFRDVTEEAGLAGKRFRRTYSGSLVDLDDDRDLDLVTISDFAGIDIFLNDGNGHFTDVSDANVDERHLFGMSHVFGDFNRDGKLDIFAVGMTSSVAERLEQMRLGRSEFPTYQAMRPVMYYGNRLYFGDGGKFRQLPMSDQARDAGWAWGAAAFDFDNDGDQDLYVVNGHISRSSARDYDTRFWTHDIYLADSKLDAARHLYFQSLAQESHNTGQSYGGYHRNNLFINENGRSFLEAAYLMGLAFPRDYRNVLADDLDGDGKMDLILTIYEDWPRPRQELHILRNVQNPIGHWIGFRFDESNPEFSPVGAQVTLTTARGRQIRRIVCGDSYRAQNSFTAHFGMGDEDSIIDCEFRWPNGTTKKLENLAIDGWYGVTP